MTYYQKLFLFLVRVTLGWMYFYAGITKLTDPTWSSVGYLGGAKQFAGLYAWFASPSVLPVVDALNEWGLTLLGVSLILGIGVRLSTSLGALLMLLYYLALGFPMPNAHAFIVDEHIIYSAMLLYLGSVRAGRVWGLEEWCSGLPICARFPRLRSLLG